MDPLLDSPLATIASALREGKTTAEQLTRLAIERHAARDDKLHAYQTFDADHASNQARAADAARAAGAPVAPLCGIPISAKDLFGVQGFPTYAGTRARLPAEWELEGFLIGALRSQHAVLVGKTHMVELAFGGLGTNPNWNTPINPWDAADPRVPGGSSSGAGVSLWEGSAVIALGSDTAGSIRIPASMTGVVGHKTSLGRWPTTGVFPLSSTLDTVGALARTVMDAAFFFAAVDPRLANAERFLATAEGASLSGIRIGVCSQGVWDACSSDIATTARGALRELEDRGACLVEIDLPELEEACDLYMSGMIVPPECATFLTTRFPGMIDTLQDIIGERLRGAGEVLAADYISALARRRELARAAALRFESVDVLATPTVPITPPPISEVSEIGGYMRANRQTSRATNPVNVLDLCAVSMPCGLDDAGMPVGLQLIGPHGDDERLLTMAAAAERILGTARERLGVPPLLSLD